MSAYPVSHVSQERMDAYKSKLPAAAAAAALFKRSPSKVLTDTSVNVPRQNPNSLYSLRSPYNGSQNYRHESPSKQLNTRSSVHYQRQKQPVYVSTARSYSMMTPPTSYTRSPQRYNRNSATYHEQFSQFGKNASSLDQSSPANWDTLSSESSAEPIRYKHQNSSYISQPPASPSAVRVSLSKAAKVRQGPPSPIIREGEYMPSSPNMSSAPRPPTTVYGRQRPTSSGPINSRAHSAQPSVESFQQPNYSSSKPVLSLNVPSSAAIPSHSGRKLTQTTEPTGYLSPTVSIKKPANGILHSAHPSLRASPRKHVSLSETISTVTPSDSDFEDAPDHFDGVKPPAIGGYNESHNANTGTKNPQMRRLEQTPTRSVPAINISESGNTRNDAYPLSLNADERSPVRLSASRYEPQKAYSGYEESLNSVATSQRTPISLEEAARRRVEETLRNMDASLQTTAVPPQPIVQPRLQNEMVPPMRSMSDNVSVASGSSFKRASASKKKGFFSRLRSKNKSERSQTQTFDANEYSGYNPSYGTLDRSRLSLRQEYAPRERYTADFAQSSINAGVDGRRNTSSFAFTTLRGDGMSSQKANDTSASRQNAALPDSSFEEKTSFKGKRFRSIRRFFKKHF
ncbi:hypothetical protein SJAG_02087 [Schizosaccharomyces japonicus yFS275]|uniref:Uncharacterized protein n=1 Tax=Schizosaccharomyces japonicus (strain yFS275 / FY16936) TaxID=402676 RepID=B6JZP5_SCHJY|nr:hypothetical protein SJAG_02087 [Schizosaccharomyces japonicus yFS275]EEB07013.1 hypothetical protein SJAG_02087 [Schizosaccharomyces japonicus yFS275]